MTVQQAFSLLPQDIQSKYPPKESYYGILCLSSALCLSDQHEATLVLVDSVSDITSIMITIRDGVSSSWITEVRPISNTLWKVKVQPDGDKSTVRLIKFVLTDNRMLGKIHGQQFSAWVDCTRDRRYAFVDLNFDDLSHGERGSMAWEIHQIRLQVK